MKSPKVKLVAADSSALIEFFQGRKTKDAKLVEKAIKEGVLALPWIVLSEMLMIENLSLEIKEALSKLTILQPSCNYSKNLAKVRLKMQASKFNANLTQCLVATSCLESNIALISVNRNYLGFAKLLKLKLL
jgi:predicted nucleic acid-binding protein